MMPDNPRHPHTCKIYRMEGETSFKDGTEKILYEGACRKYGNTSIRTLSSKNVVKGDYALSVPGTVSGIRAGDLIDVKDRQGAFSRCLVTDSYAGNLGTTVYFNIPKN